MNLIIDETHVASSESGKYWKLSSTGKRIRSAVRRHAPKSIIVGTLRNLANDLLYHGIIRPEQAQLCEEAHRTVQRVADRLSDQLKLDSGAAVVFDNRQFLVERGLGDWIAANPGKSVARIQGEKDFVGAWPSLAYAMFAVLERKFHASAETIPYNRVNSAMLAIAETLTKDAGLIDRTKPSPEAGEPSLGSVVRVLAASALSTLS